MTAVINFSNFLLVNLRLQVIKGVGRILLDDKMAWNLEREVAWILEREMAQVLENETT